MRIKRLEISKEWTGEPRITAILPKFEVHHLSELVSIPAEEIAEKWQLNIEKIKRKRSLDANAYAWVLMNKIAVKIQATAEEVYRQLIAELGAYEIIPVKTEKLEKWQQIWQGKGTGWLVEDLGECRNIKGYHNMKCHYGSSVYDSEQMARLIDGIVAECKTLGIETMTPAEIKQLKANWEVRK